MPQRTTTIRIPEPCPESWDAMTPTDGGRHCAACQKTVVDFTLMSDAEILAFLTQATGETCGRLGSHQLNRPLRPAAPGQTSRWRAWLVLALAAWGVRAEPAAAGTPSPGPRTTAHPRKKTSARHRLAAPSPQLLRGTVRDGATHEPLAGVAVFLKGENRSATTDSAGHFSLRLPGQRPRAGRALVLHYMGYKSATVAVPAAAPAALQLELLADPAAAGATIVGYDSQPHVTVTGGAIAVVRERPAPKPLPWHPRSFWRWLTRPFRAS